jgi:hypothetical protein
MSGCRRDRTLTCLQLSCYVNRLFVIHWLQRDKRIVQNLLHVLRDPEQLWGGAIANEVVGHSCGYVEVRMAPPVSLRLISWALGVGEEWCCLVAWVRSGAVWWHG